MNVGVLGNLRLDRAGDELLDVHGGTARPLADGDGHTHRDVRILALRHRSIAIDAPQDRAEEQHPGHLTMLGEEAPAVACLLNDLRVSLVCHGKYPAVSIKAERALADRRAAASRQS